MSIRPFRSSISILSYGLRTSLIITILLLVFPSTVRAEGQTSHIIGGEEAAEGAYPWAVALVTADEPPSVYTQFCGGTLIAPQWILTAAHCTFKGRSEREPDNIEVLLGTNSTIAGDGERVRVKEYIRHPNYIRASATADLALLRLERPISIATIEVADGTALTAMEQQESIAIGWGKTESKGRSDKLRQVNVPIVEYDTCFNSYQALGYILNKTMICAGYAEGGKDACSGDSGSPLLTPIIDGDERVESGWRQVGIVSWGKGCAQPDAYGVYTNVGRFAGWINEQISGTVSTSTDEIRGATETDTTLYLPILQYR